MQSVRGQLPSGGGEVALGMGEMMPKAEVIGLITKGDIVPLQAGA